MPALTWWVKCSCLSRPRLRNEKVSAPLWQLTAIGRALLAAGSRLRLGSWKTGLKVATSGLSGLTMPSELGPQTTMPWRSAICAQLDVARARRLVASPRQSRS